MPATSSQCRYGEWLTYGRARLELIAFTSHSTQNRSFLRRPSQPICWLRQDRQVEIKCMTLLQEVIHEDKNYVMGSDWIRKCCRTLFKCLHISRCTVYCGMMVTLTVVQQLNTCAYLCCVWMLVHWVQQLNTCAYLCLDVGSLSGIVLSCMEACLVMRVNLWSLPIRTFWPYYPQLPSLTDVPLTSRCCPYGTIYPYP